MKLLRAGAIAGLVTLFSVSMAQAGVVIGGTRVIYDGVKKEASLGIRNPDSVPFLIQSWLEPEEGKSEKAPFVITPPLYRLDAGQQNTLRIVRAGAVGEDKESLYWMNIKSIPSSSGKPNVNTLQIAVKSRIKLIYRPASLKGQIPETVSEQLRFSFAGNQLAVVNPTKFYMNFSEIKVGGKPLPKVTYAAPGSTVRFTLPAGVSSGPVTFKLINDYGGITVEKQGITG